MATKKKMAAKKTRNDSKTAERFKAQVSNGGKGPQKGGKKGGKGGKKGPAK